MTSPVAAAKRDQKRVELSRGAIRYADSGSGDAIVFIHGALVNGALWRDVVPE